MLFLVRVHRACCTGTTAADVLGPWCTPGRVVPRQGREEVYTRQGTHPGYTPPTARTSSSGPTSGPSSEPGSEPDLRRFIGIPSKSGSRSGRSRIVLSYALLRRFAQNDRFRPARLGCRGRNNPGFLSPAGIIVSESDDSWPFAGRVLTKCVKGGDSGDSSLARSE